MKIKEILKRSADPRATKEFVRTIATKDTDSMTRAILRWIDVGMIPKEVIKMEIYNKFVKIVKKAVKKGKLEGNKLVTVENVMEQIRNDVNTMALIDKVGMDISVLENQANEIIGK